MDPHQRAGIRALQSPRMIMRILCAALFVVSSALAQDAATSGTPASIPTFRQADDIAIIVIEGPIDEWTAHSVERRISDAEAGGADAIVFELDTPGGGVGAVLRITNAIKGSSVANTVAWVHPDAYSGGAIIALACREIVISDPGAVGDAFQVIPAGGPFGGGLRAPTPDERTKILPVIMSDVVDSARRNGYDEWLVQAMVIDGVELWLIEDAQTGQRYTIDEDEYRALFDEAPPRGRPMLAGVTGGRYESTREGPQASSPVAPPSAPRDIPTEEEADDGAPAADESSEPDDIFGDLPPTPEGQKFRPAGRNLNDIADAFEDESVRQSLEITSETQRPYFTTISESEKDRYTPLGYVCDGTNAVILRTEDAINLGLASRVINTDEELQAFFGAESLTRLQTSWSERAAAFLASPGIRMLLIVVFLLSLFVEMVSPGMFVPLLISLVALAGLMGPPMVVGMAGWWEALAIVGGIALLGVEVFVLPGMGLFGVIGIVSIFVGLVGTFIPDSGSGLRSNPGELAWSAGMVLLALLTAGIGMFFITKHMGSLPILNRLVLGASSDEPEGAFAMMAPPQSDLVPVGSEGVSITPLRPSGQAEIEGEVCDVVSDMGYVEPGQRVRVVRANRFSLVVEPIEGTEGSA